MILLLSGGFFAVDVAMARSMGPGIGSFLMAFFFGVSLFWGFLFLWAFPVLAVWEGNLKDAAIVAFTLSLRNLPRTVGMGILTAAALWVVHLIPVLAVAAFGILAHTEAAWLLRGLEPWLPADLREEDPDGE